MRYSKKGRIAKKKKNQIGEFRLGGHHTKEVSHYRINFKNIFSENAYCERYTYF